MSPLKLVNIWSMVRTHFILLLGLVILADGALLSTTVTFASLYSQAVESGQPGSASVQDRHFPPTSTPPPACGLNWRVMSSPNVAAAFTAFTAVDAVSPTDIWAVGYSGFGDQTLIQRWNGSSWSIVPSPNPGTYNRLFGVVALSANEAWAVGSTESQPLFLRWDGSTWSHVAAPTTGSDNVLYAVDAVSPTDIWAVGSSSGATLTMRWNGTTWSRVPSPNIGVFGSGLFGVTAIAANDVWAVGYSSGPDRTLTIRWDGTSWSHVPSPTPADADYPRFSAVDAVASGDVWAVGSYMGNGRIQSLIAHWDGAAWSLVSHPSPGSNLETELLAVHAISANDVWAVGFSTFSSSSTLTQHWDGTQWAIVPSANPDPNTNRLYGVTAHSSGDIWAVGYRTDSSNTTRTLVERYTDPCLTPSPSPTGSPVASSTTTPTSTPSCMVGWGSVPGPNSGSGDNALLGIDAGSSNDVWAVGYYSEGSASRGLIERWNGSQWDLVPAPDAGQSSILRGVDVVSSTDAWAVGEYRNGSVTQTLTLRWNGTQWSQIPSPNVGSGTNSLYGVAAASANDVWAVGAAGGGSSLVMRWNGSQWTVVASPNPGGPYGNILYSVTVIAANDVWAVGAHSTGPNPDTLTIHWNGTQWTHVPSPSPGNQYQDYLHDVSAVASNDVWAVGYYFFNGRGRTLTLHWDGNSWTQIASPNVGSDHNYLTGVVALATNNVWAVGYYGNPSQTSIMRWNGTSWGTTPSPNPGVAGNALNDIAAVSSNELWAVGNYSDGSLRRTLTARYVGVCPTPISTPTPVTTATSTRTSTSTPTYTTVAQNTPTAIPTSCTLRFADVPSNHTFYPSVRCLACRGIISGYADGTFKPDNLVTRGQLAKIVSNAAGFNEPPGAQIFQDVPTDHTFYEWINRLTNRGYMSGYTCGNPGEPCVNNRPYFRPFANATRAQTSKIVSNAARYNDPPTGQTFEDVPPTHPFYVEIQRLASRNIMGGYQCGSPGEPCILPLNRPYFRPYNDVTRGQSAKIVANTFYPDCQTP